MRARAVLAALALAGTVLLGGAAPALADGHDDWPTSDVGNVKGDADFGKLEGTFD
ncbi:hypothetical protein ACWCRD_07805 [Streptomyces sp. NPDC002092]